MVIGPSQISSENRNWRFESGLTISHSTWVYKFKWGTLFMLNHYLRLLKLAPLWTSRRARTQKAFVYSIIWFRMWRYDHHHVSFKTIWSKHWNSASFSLWSRFTSKSSPFRLHFLAWWTPVVVQNKDALSRDSWVYAAWGGVHVDLTVSILRCWKLSHS
jgi:hypothetical protein